MEAERLRKHDYQWLYVMSVYETNVVQLAKNEVKVLRLRLNATKMLHRNTAVIQGMWLKQFLFYFFMRKKTTCYPNTIIFKPNKNKYSKVHKHPVTTAEKDLTNNSKKINKIK